MSKPKKLRVTQEGQTALLRGLDPEMWALVKSAAMARGVKLSEFVQDATHKEALRVLQAAGRG